MQASPQGLSLTASLNLPPSLSRPSSTLSLLFLLFFSSVSFMRVSVTPTRLKTIYRRKWQLERRPMSAAKRQRKTREREREKGNTGCAGDGAGGSRKSIGVKSVNEVCCETVREARYGFANSRARRRYGTETGADGSGSGKNKNERA